MTVQVAAYVRASVDREGTGLSVDRQLEDVQRLCDSRGWTIAATFSDNDVSATSKKPRPQFIEMMKRVDSGEFDVIAARHMDRLLRRLTELESVLERCTATDTAVVTASDGVDTSTDGGRLVARILSSVAQGETERKGARQRSAAVQAAKAGKPSPGRRAFGYANDGVTIIEAEAELIRQGYADILSGESLSMVARKWTATGVRTSNGKTWSRQAARDVLTNPRNCALRRYRNSEENYGRRREPEVGIVAPGNWPAIVDESTWRAAARILSDPARWTGGRGEKHLLTGVATCAVCGRTVLSTGGTQRPNYRCSSMTHFARKLQTIDEWVCEVAIAALSKPGAAQLWSTVDTTALMAKADLLRQRLADLDEDYASMSRERWRALNEQLQSELADVEGQLVASTPRSPVGKVATAKDPRATWELLTVPQKRRVIDTIMTVVIHPPGMGIRKFDPSTVVCTPKASK
ncbi:recombinase family protein [Mycolicibacterium sp.]|uniref:recombinase family protein n=1 Tax=Mycolicibacterium sp. TaxID=2320850 RepID=UPI001A275944|nr:recombinase family protein [Mycolicibacterium sp.]MBJ7401713.1 recombinase family protein [Mycolicibacterium sp.]